MVVGDLIGEGSAQDQSVVGETPTLAAWPPPRDRAGDIDPNNRRSPRLARQIFGDLIEHVRVCKDSPLEGDGFELSVPRMIGGRFRTKVRTRLRAPDLDDAERILQAAIATPRSTSTRSVVQVSQCVHGRRAVEEASKILYGGPPTSTKLLRVISTAA
jgi:hypothetical protein